MGREGEAFATRIFSVYVGFTLQVRARRRTLQETPIVRLHSAEEVELKARFLLEDYMKFKLTQSIWNGASLSAAGSDAGDADGDLGGGPKRATDGDSAMAHDDTQEADFAAALRRKSAPY